MTGKASWLAGAVLALTLPGASEAQQGGRSIQVLPTAHDFGSEIVGKTVDNPLGRFLIVLSAGARATDSIVVWPPQAVLIDWKLDQGPSWFNTGGVSFGNPPGLQCNAGSSVTQATGTLLPATTVQCLLRVWFQPASPGPKQATITLRDVRGGGTATITLTGIGVSGCVYTVVQGCNYAPMYSGVFGWTSILNGPASQSTENVQVNWVNGVATCSGTATSTFKGQRRTGTITGPGLVAVEWLDDSMYPWVYRITAACPTPDWPAGPNGEAATPSQPAELGHNDRSTDKQPDPTIKQGMSLQQAIAGVAMLQGTLSYPAPETDALNGVTGTVTITWNLKRN